MKRRKNGWFPKKLAAFAAASLLVFTLGACGAGGQDASEAADEPAAESSEPAVDSVAASQPDEEGGDAVDSQKERFVMVEIKMQDGGVIKLELDREAAPLTVENFETLVGEQFYDGLIFHRIISGFMIQGGDPTGTGMGGPGHEIKGEFAENGWDNPISHEPGVISMARSGDPDSAGSQFFIVHGDATFLDGKYAAFGKVTEGMDVVDRLASVETDGGDRPLEDVVIETIRIVDGDGEAG